MPPSASTGENIAPLLEVAAEELDQLRDKSQMPAHGFPNACHAMLANIEGNNQCIDCGASYPQWATVKYGALLCLHCSGKHRSLGVQVSCVRSITMDDWSLQDILTMLEGGNGQLQSFFTRHALCADTHEEKPGKVLNSENVILMRYKTKAALFYRQQLEKHVSKIVESGSYRGREHSRNKSPPPQRPLSKAKSNIG